MWHFSTVEKIIAVDMLLFQIYHFMSTLKPQTEQHILVLKKELLYQHVP
jgi:hypothetical protein